MAEFEPNYNYFVEAVLNKRSARMPLYEHIISPKAMETIQGKLFAEQMDSQDTAERNQAFDQYCRFWRQMTYDTVSWEMCLTSILPEGGAIAGGKAGPIQNRSDFEAYPWDELPQRYWTAAEPRLKSLRLAMPAGMKAVGGVGNGIFEISEDLVGFEYLSYMQIDDPSLFADLYQKIGDLLESIWKRLLAEYNDIFCVYRFGDDLGYKTGLLISKGTALTHILPQYRRLIARIKKTGKPFLWHSCGCIFEIMDDVIACGINAKHSNEDGIAPFERWIEQYNDRIALLGGIDVDLLCQTKPEDVRKITIERGRLYRKLAKGYALGSGNSIPDYVPADAYLAMVEAARQLRLET
jgi:uroporphyrinogen decarboxylase